MRKSERKTLLLTGASRGIGHATVKYFSNAGWRVISCSRYPLPKGTNGDRLDKFTQIWNCVSTVGSNAGNGS